MCTDITGSTIALITASIWQFIVAGTVVTRRNMPATSRSHALMVWRQSVAHIRRASMANGMYSSSIYFRRAEDISIEFVPNHLEAHNGNTVAMFDLKNRMGQPIGLIIGVWNIDEWQRIDNEGAATMWLDHSTSAWSQSDTQWYLNELSAITMLNTHRLCDTVCQAHSAIGANRTS
eukprot:6491596-Amphidinium_carterae.3